MLIGEDKILEGVVHVLQLIGINLIVFYRELNNCDIYSAHYREVVRYREFLALFPGLLLVKVVEGLV